MENKMNKSTEQDENKGVSEDLEQSTSNACDLFGETVKSLSSVYPKLEGIMKQKEQMATTMIRVMQQLIQTGIKIRTKFEALQDGSRLIISIHNTTGLPIHGMTGSIDFKPIPTTLDHKPTEAMPEVPTLTWISSSQRTITEQPTEHPVDPLFFSPNDATGTSTTTSTTNTTTTTLYPNTTHVEVLCINTTYLTRYNGLINIQIPFPGNADGDGDGTNSARLAHSFGVYLIDQMKKLVSPDKSMECTNEEEGQGIEKEYHGQFIRDIFAINPVLGLEKGMCLCLTPTSGENSLITCRIESTSLDHGNILVRFYGKNKNLVESLVQELDYLKK